MSTDPTALDWPMFGLTEDIRPALGRLAEHGREAALATLVQAQGGSPRGLGAQMLISGDEVSGYLSGGCIEADIVHQARAVVETGQPRRIVYGQGGAIDLRLPCGGRIEVLLEKLDLAGEAVRRVLLAHQARLPCLWVTDGERQLCLLPGERPPERLAALLPAAGQGVCGEVGSFVFRRFDPRPRLLVVGGDPPALAIASLGAQCGLETVLLRPNGPAAAPPIPEITYLRASPEEALGRLAPDRWTAVVAATHTAEIDDQVIRLALASPAAYVGVLGSTRKIEERNRRLRRDGIAESALARLRAPLGLPLGGKAPWTIALATLAQIVGELNRAESTQGWSGPPAGDLRIDAIVLAAGAARRFGGGKLMAPMGKGVVLDGALKAAFGLGGKVHLVAAPQDRTLQEAAKSTARELGRTADLCVVLAHDHAEGLAGSLRAGVRSALTADAVAVFLGDMPLVPETAGPSLASALRAGAQAAAFVRDGQRGHPVAFSQPLYAELLALSGDRGASGLLDRLGPALALIETDQDGLFDDIDTLGDLRRLAG